MVQEKSSTKPQEDSALTDKLRETERTFGGEITMDTSREGAFVKRDGSAVYKAQVSGSWPRYTVELIPSGH